MALNVPTRFASAELEVKKSRFIAWAAPVSSRQQALQWVDKAKAEYADARHHCWAYQLGDSEMATHAAANDDGEPSGTAGKPILNVIQHKQIGNVVVIVIRYFGGVKLGAGGLVRAYAGATEMVLSALPVEQPVPTSDVKVLCDFAHEQTIRHWCTQHQAEVAAVAYTQQVALTVSLPTEYIPQLRALCASLGADLRLGTVD